MEVELTGRERSSGVEEGLFSEDGKDKDCTSDMADVNV